MTLYFAYGSNMSPRQMRARCPGAQAGGAGLLSGWRFVITTRGTANIVADQEGAVHGALWRVSGRHLAELDLWEGVASGSYRRRWVRVSVDGRMVTALTYISARRWPGRARADYVLTAVLPGATAFALPEAYRNEISGWLPTRPVGPRRRRYLGRRRAARA